MKMHHLIMREQQHKMKMHHLIIVHIHIRQWWRSIR
jgi:hypothetical protein